MINAIMKESPNLILHLGDNSRDCNELKLKFPDIPLRSVNGNCDRTSPGEEFDEFTFAGKKFFITHGHTYGVKMSLRLIIDDALSKDVDILAFGHTHIPYYAVMGTLTVVNPGSVGFLDATYAVLEIKDGVVTCDVKNI